jgi:hypothetical protein
MLFSVTSKSQSPASGQVSYWRREEGAEPSWVRVEPGFPGNPGDTRASAYADARHPANILFGYRYSPVPPSWLSVSVTSKSQSPASGQLSYWRREEGAEPSWVRVASSTCQWQVSHMRLSSSEERREWKKKSKVKKAPHGRAHKKGARNSEISDTYAGSAYPDHWNQIQIDSLVLINQERSEQGSETSG